MHLSMGLAFCRAIVAATTELEHSAGGMQDYSSPYPPPCTRSFDRMVGLEARKGVVVGM